MIRYTIFVAINQYRIHHIFRLQNRGLRSYGIDRSGVAYVESIFDFGGQNGHFRYFEGNFVYRKSYVPRTVFSSSLDEE